MFGKSHKDKIRNEKIGYQGKTLIGDKIGER